MKTENQLETGQRLTSCPDCHSNAKVVGAATLKAMLNDDIVSQFDVESEAETDSCCSSDCCQPEVHETRWRFCGSAECDVVYFSESSETTFRKSQLKVPVGIKETSGERPLCYCFDHSVASIKEEIRANGKSVALEEIRAKMKDPGCRCERENPSGSCCLGSVANGIQVAANELGLSDSEIPSTKSPNTSTTGRGEKIARFGTLLSAIMASSCCWLPLLLLAVGVSGAGIVSTLEAYRPLFMTVTFGFLAAAFYFTYRPKKVGLAGGDNCCPTEPTIEKSCCSSTSKRRFSMQTMNKVMFWWVTAMSIGFLFFPSYVGILLGGGGETVSEEMNRAVFKIEGMTCEGCAATLEKTLQFVPGVLAVEVDFNTGEALVGTMSCCLIPEEGILATVRKRGFEGQLLRANPAILNSDPGK